MAGDLGRLAVVLGLDFTEFKNGLTKSEQTAKDAMSRVERNTQKSISNIEGAFKNLAGVVSLAVLVTGFKSLVDELDHVGEAAERVGVSVESFSALSYAAKLSATDAATLEGALARVNLAVANMGNDIDAKGGAELEALGIKIKDAAGQAKSADQVFLDVADKLSKIENQATKTAFANKIFGNGLGGQLIPLLNQGRDGIEALTNEAREMGIVIGTDAAEAAGKFNDRLDQTGEKLRSIGRDIVGDVLPSLNSLIEKFNAARKSSLFGFLTTSGADEADTGKSIADLTLKLGGLYSELGKFDNLNPVTRKLNDVIYGDEGDLQKQIAGTEAQIKYLLEIEKQRDADAARANKPRPASSGPDPRLPTTATAPKLTEGDRLIKQLQEQRSQVGLLTQEEQTNAKLGLISSKEITAAQRIQAVELARGIDMKNMDAEATKKNQEYLDEWIETLEKQDQRLGDLTGRNAIEQRVKDIQMLNAAYADGEGSINFEEYQQGIDSLWGKSQQRFDEIGEFALQAARNIQTSLGQGLFDILDGKFSDIGASFGNLLKKMAAEAAAAQLSKYLFGGFDKTGAIGGLAGTLISSLGFGTIGGKAVGGMTPPNSFMRVNENGPEIYNEAGKSYVMTGDKGGSITPLTTAMSSAAGRGSSQPIVNIHNNAPTRVSARSGTDASGMPSLDIYIDQIEAELADRARQGKGPLVNANQARYGLRPRLS